MAASMVKADKTREACFVVVLNSLCKKLVKILLFECAMPSVSDLILSLENKKMYPGIMLMDNSQASMTPKLINNPNPCKGGIGTNAKVAKPIAVVNDVNSMGINNALMT